jgi:glutathione S-transferase
MILIGQYDSPFVRRVAIAMRLYGLSFQHERWSVFGDGDAIAVHNPLRRVPTLICDDGVAIHDSHLILDWLDQRVPPEQALAPVSGDARRTILRVAGFACGVADKAVSLFYELRLHEATSALWVERCRAQIVETLGLLEHESAALTTPFWAGAAPGHADIAIACMIRFVSEAHHGLFDAAACPALAALAARCEAMDVFAQICQPFNPPA